MRIPPAKLWVPLAALAALGAAMGAFLGAGGPGIAPDRPPAAGEVGRVVVYGQTPSGPVALAPGLPGRRPPLMRPQELVFWFQVDGTGPRDVRIEVTAWDRRHVVFEDRFEAPVEGRYLDVTLPLDERAPDRLQLTTVVEPPHAMNLETTYRIRLEGPRDARDEASGR